jgi:hypothetical protein
MDTPVLLFQLHFLPMAGNVGLQVAAPSTGSTPNGIARFRIEGVSCGLRLWSENQVRRTAENELTNGTRAHVSTATEPGKRVPVVHASGIVRKGSLFRPRLTPERTQMLFERQTPARPMNRPFAPVA